MGFRVRRAVTWYSTASHYYAPVEYQRTLLILMDTTPLFSWWDVGSRETIVEAYVDSKLGSQLILNSSNRYASEYSL